MLLAVVNSSNGGEELRDWLVALGTVAAIIVALLFGLGFKEWLFRPRLRLRFDPRGVSDLVVTDTPAGPAAYVRLRVANAGQSSAKAVRVSVLSVAAWVDTTRRWIDGKPELQGRALVWSNTANLETVDIAPKTERVFDLFSIHRDWANQGDMPVELSIGALKPFNRADKLSPGGWLVEIELTADNVSAQRAYVAFRFDGIWPADPPHRIWKAVATTGATSTRPASPPRPEIWDPEEMLAEAIEQDTQPEA